MQKRQRGGSVKLTVTLSLLAAIGVILGKFLAVNVTEFMRFSLENITIILTGIVFGPVLGAVLGAVQDLVGCLAVGYAINPLITLGSAAVGAVSGVCYILLNRLGKHVRIALSVLAAHLVGSVMIKSLGLCLFYALPLGATVAWRLLNYVIVGTTEAFLICYLLKSKQLLAQINKMVSFSPDGFKSAEDAQNYARSVSGVFSKPGLDRVRALLSGLGSPEREVKVVHLTGTNGKGSTSAILTQILVASGLRVGSFNSPYLTEMREAIRINGKPIDTAELVDLFDRLRPIADGLSDKPTEFELLSAAAYLKFKEAGVDLAVIECGMGARRDATNVIDAPLLSVITGISVDHTAYLGSDTAAIAREKAGIIKQGVTVLVGELDRDAMAVISEEAKSLGAPIVRPDEATVHSMTLGGTVMDCGSVTDVRLPLLGVHQTKNAALAIKAAELLQECFPTVTRDTVREGISHTVWEARLEILSKSPLFIFDGAHNFEGVKYAVESIRTYFDTKVVYLGGVLADKDYERMAEDIATVSDIAVTVAPKSARALSAEDYAKVLATQLSCVYAAKSVEDGVKKALEIAEREGLPIVCLGSLYLYNDVKTHLLGQICK